MKLFPSQIFPSQGKVSEGRFKIKFEKSEIKSIELKDTLNNLDNFRRLIPV